MKHLFLLPGRAVSWLVALLVGGLALAAQGQTADVAAGISASSPLQTGSTATFTLSFTNNGPGTASTVTRQVQLPTGRRPPTVAPTPAARAW